MREEAVTSLRELNEVVERLRGPGGCPWDAQQTHRTLRQYLLEETYETLEAIEGERYSTLREELGDVLLQVLMHSAIAMENEDEGFDIGHVADTTKAKMINRHPHVFGDAVVDGAPAVASNWERLKAEEKNERMSVIDGVPLSLPALAFALGLQKRPARVGFDLTPTQDDAIAWVRRTLEAVSASAAQAGRARAAHAAAIRPGAHDAAPPPASVELEDALGELLFAVVAVARRVRVNPEDALRRHAGTFAARFRTAEATLRAEGVDVHEARAEDWRSRWDSSTLSDSG